MIIAALGAALSGAEHASLYVLQTRHWLEPRTMDFFGITSAEDARATLKAARQQGRYNLMLAAMAVAGALLLIPSAQPWPIVAATLMTASTLCMTFAALMSIIAEPYRRKWATLQLVPPLVTLALLAVALLG
ncbi:epimerase [Bifidobacterium sp. DSM 109958]|uniref:Epimerase n=2 Tax=Bifidobacterium moraviense TaxID=2675323 RepID=A0A7Y0HZW5_9BIFI|nr:epimerase [Bifidobacterium sp. DSM 109958]